MYYVVAGSYENPALAAQQRMMRQLLQRVERAFGATIPRLWAHAKAINVR